MVAIIRSCHARVPDEDIGSVDIITDYSSERRMSGLLGWAGHGNWFLVMGCCLHTA